MSSTEQMKSLALECRELPAQGHRLSSVKANSQQAILNLIEEYTEAFGYRQSPKEARS